MTHSTQSTSLNWTQDKLKKHMAEHDLSDPKGNILGLPVIQKLNKKWCTSKNGTVLMRNDVVKHIDVQAKLEKKMSEKQKLEEFEACLNDDTHLKYRPKIASIHYIASLPHTTIAEDLKMIAWNFYAVILLNLLIPQAQKVMKQAVYTLMEKKINAYSIQDQNGSIAHVNPTQSLDAIKGMNYCLPAFENPAKYYNVPALRRDTDESAPVNYKLLNDKHALLYDIVEFRSNKSK